MMVVDTSAVITVLLAEKEADHIALLMAENDLYMSAGTYAELLCVATRRNLLNAVTALIQALDVKIIPVDKDQADLVGQTYQIYGEGLHPAGLNFGDCFAYALAKMRQSPLLFVGKDFSKTDLKSALS